MNKNIIHEKINSLTYEQLCNLFIIYCDLNVLCDYFMPEESYTEFMNFYLETPSKRTPVIFKSLIHILTEQYTYQHRYPHLLCAIDMIRNDYPLEKIIDLLHRTRNEQFVCS